MRSLTLLALFLVPLLLLARSAQTLPASSLEAPEFKPEGSYVVDSGHSGVLFCIEHLGVANFWGRFNKVEGAFELADDMEQCSVEISIDAASVDTNSEGRDKHIKGPDFFNVKEYPKITFVSQRVSDEDGQFLIEGELSMLGETQDVGIKMRKIGEAETRMGVKCGFEGELVFDRKDFGMTALEGGLGTTIRCILFIEANKEK